MIQLPQFFAVVLVLSILGILIYVLFLLLCRHIIAQAGGSSVYPG